jgi:hypothetical protein
MFFLLVPNKVPIPKYGENILCTLENVNSSLDFSNFGALQLATFHLLHVQLNNQAVN